MKHEIFRFTEVDAEDIKKEILKLSKTKASQVSDILIKFIKDNVDICIDFICENINSAFQSFLFLQSCS